MKFRDISFLGFRYRSDLIARDYMRRWTLVLPTGHMLRVHKILRSDSRDHLHDHPFDFVSLILKGGYIEFRPTTPKVGPCKCFVSKEYRPGSIVNRRAEDLHALELINGPAWTFVISGPIRREWGFATEDGWICAGDYDEWKRSKAKAVAR